MKDRHMAVNCTISKFLQVYLYAINLYIFIYCSIPVCKYTTIYLFIVVLMDIWVVSSLGMLWIRLLWTFWYMAFGEQEYLLQVRIHQQRNGWDYIWFNFSGYLQNSFSMWLYQKLHFNNRKVRRTFNEKRSLRIQDFNFPETILHLPFLFSVGK